MFKLIRKDILIQINFILLAVPFSIFFVIIFPRAYPDLGYVMGASAIVYMLAIAASSIETRNHTDIILNSLPLLRSEIILSKYLGIFIFTVIGLMIMIFSGLAVNIFPLPFHIRSITWQEIAITFIMAPVLAAIYFPLFYKLNYGAASSIIYILLFQFALFGPNFINEYISEHMNQPWIQQLLHVNANTPWVLPLIGAAAAILLIMVSYLFTVKIYTARDL